ncbi:hypothetical protein BDZ91DRAFT_239101 [Kalaharituber pfeilii]|nr:hypothetical protein BDZ91DRAFT_239101 [Kalaharituber pfeilii]
MQVPKSVSLIPSSLLYIFSIYPTVQYMSNNKKKKTGTLCSGSVCKSNYHSK